ncbi:MAG: response regulator [Rhodospirillales bacterium]|nr:response regulator [Rhodospirillales bacterium]
MKIPETAMRALVVEDSVREQNRLRLVLSQMGFDVDVTSNKHDALRQGRERLYDVAIVDLQLDTLPGGDLRGIEVIAELCQAARGFPIIVWTNQSGWEPELKAHEAGAAAYLRKSPNAASLQECVRSLVACGSDKRLSRGK